MRVSTPDMKKRMKPMVMASHSPLRLARVNGSVDSNDQYALVSLAAQLRGYERRNKAGGIMRERNFITNLDSLENAFRNSRFDKHPTPTVIIIEDIHVYASSTRQVLLYALLD